MGSEGRKKTPFRTGYSFPLSVDEDRPDLREPAELAGETRFIPMDVLESDTDLCLALDLPGVSIDDVTVSLQDLWVVVEGTKRDLRESRARAVFLCSERSFGPFKRVFKIPMAVDLDTASAVYRKGVLRVILPKLLDRRRKRRTIPITKME